jgi:hypothetical protein
MKIQLSILFLLSLTIITSCGEPAIVKPNDICSCLAYMEPVLAEQVLHFEDQEKMAQLELAARSDENGKLCIELMDQESARMHNLGLTQDEEYNKMEEVLGACSSYVQFKITSGKLTDLLMASMDFSEFSELDQDFADDLDNIIGSMDSVALDTNALAN